MITFLVLMTVFSLMAAFVAGLVYGYRACLRDIQRYKEARKKTINKILGSTNHGRGPDQSDYNPEQG